MGGSKDTIIIKGAREHNLKNIDVEIPKNKLIVFTGVSGSGKSSLAMDTIYAEGQRRYVESLSAYARQFLGVMGKPDVDSIEGLSPAIAIDQKTTSKNPRSTVGTVTEIYDFLRLLFARVGHPHCPECGREISRQSSQQITNKIIGLISDQEEFKTQRGVRVLIMSPVVKDRKGEYSALFANLKKQGILRARIDGQIRDLSDHFELIKTNKHTIEAILNRLIVNKSKLDDKQERKDFEMNLFQSVEIALRMGGGNVILSIVRDKEFDFSDSPKDLEDHLFSENFACPVCNISLPDLEPRSFSFNSPHGACPMCHGLGNQLRVDEELLVNPELSVLEGGILPWAKLFESNSWTSRVVKAVAREYGFDLDRPIKSLLKSHYSVLLYGPEYPRRFNVTYYKHGRKNSYNARFEGVIPNLMRRHKETKSDYIRTEIERYMVKEDCPQCLGTRIKNESLSVVINGKNIAEVTDLSIDKVEEWCKSLDEFFSEKESVIAETILKEIGYRLKFLLDVGLDYLTLSRSASALSGGEAQRIRLASQIGSGLSGVLYVLDEPSVGLHQKDQGQLVDTLSRLKELGNTVIVVEHDMETILRSDHVIDFGPGAGERGGDVVAVGKPKEIMRNNKSLTGKYLSGEKAVNNIKKDKELGVKKDGEKIEYLTLKGASGRNLKSIDFNIPVGKFVCVTGVSGSGKSTLVVDTLYKALRQEFGLKIYEKAEPHNGLVGTENIDKIIAIDQSPIGRTPRSNPATYTKTFDYIRKLFSKTEEARIRGYKPGRFSFNVKGGRCETCRGEGQIKIEMQFMPDVYVNCEVCEGKRYNQEALEIYYKGKNISDVLDMTVEEALSFFENIPPVRKRLKTIFDVGLGYIKLGQPAPTLSGGEAQRVKLASELAKRATGKTLYILDEPTTGLHFYDLEKLISVIKRLTSKGNTVLVIEHNLDVISAADWIIDLGPGGGDAGGEVLFSGKLSELLKHKSSYTGQALRKTKLQ